MKDDKLADAITALDHALTFATKVDSDAFYFSGITKAYEVCFEYAWKAMKRELATAGITSYSPKDTIKHAAREGIIQDAERWLNFLTDRNLSVHDYLGMTQANYLQSIEDFANEVKKLPL